jgi:NAD-dependent SIR2 family protein deacetylase
LTQLEKIAKMVAAEFDDRSEHALDLLADTLRSGHMVLFITGAGLSVASGISTYRSESTSIWSNFIYEWGTRSKFLEDRTLHNTMYDANTI